MKEPFFSIITASYNNGHNIQKTFDSISSQTFKDFEHIVIDGDSTDNTLILLKKYQEKYSLRWISEKDDGIADALNKGLQMSNGKYVIVIHADDHFADPRVLSLAHKQLMDDVTDIYSSPVWVIHSQKGKILYKPVKKIWWNHFKTIFPHQGSFVHKRVFEKVGGFDKRFAIGMDYDFFYRALKHDAKIKFGYKPIAIMGGEGISNCSTHLRVRLNEEHVIQKSNETSIVWRFAQIIFKYLYRPYKLVILPLIYRLKIKIKD